MSSATAETNKTPIIMPRKTMRGHTKQVVGVAHLPNGQRIITCSFDGSLRLWDLESGAQIGDEWRDEGDEGVLTMALSPNGRIVASGSQDGTVRLWDAETGKVIAKWKEHTQTVESVCWSPDGEQVVSGSFDGTARVWHVESGAPIQGLNPIETGHQHVYAVSYSPKATTIATCGRDGIKIWDARTGKWLSTIKFHRPVWSLTWTLDEKKLISGSRNGSIRIFDTATWQQIAVLEGHTQGIKSITLFSNDRLLASTSWDGTARLWNLDTNLQVGPPLQHEKDVQCAAFSADGKLLSTGCEDDNAYVWDVQAILKTASLEDLLFIPDAPHPELTKRSLSGVHATRRSAIRSASRQVPPDFSDKVQDGGPSPIPSRLHPDPSLRRRRSAFAFSWGSDARALLTRLPSPFRRSQPSTDEPIEPNSRLGPSAPSRHNPPAVEVPVLDAKKAL